MSRDQVATPTLENWPLNRVRRAFESDPLARPAMAGQQLTDYSWMPGYAK